MTRITIKDLAATRTLTADELARTQGGWLWMVGPVGQTIIATVGLVAAAGPTLWRRWRARRAAGNAPAPNGKVTGMIHDR